MITHASRKPSIVLVTGSLEGGGAERAMSEMANYWASRGWRVTLATWSGPEIEDFYSLAPNVGRAWLDVVSRAGSFLAKLRSNVARVSKFRRLLRASRPDAVLSFVDVSNVLTILAAFGLGLRIVVSERGCPDQTPEKSLYFLSGYWRALRKLVYWRADGVTALNVDAAEWLSRKCRVSADVIPLAVRALPEIRSARECLILGIGRLHAVKGFDLLIGAFARIAHDFPCWRLALLGNGPQKYALIGLCEELDLRDRVEFVDPVPDVEKWLARAGLVALPSRSEAFGNAVLESMAMGAPVISTNCAGPISLIDDGVNGRLVPVDDVVRLAEAMAELMSRPKTREHLGREACKIRHRFRQDLVMAQWEACLLPGYQSRQSAAQCRRAGPE